MDSSLVIKKLELKVFFLIFYLFIFFQELNHFQSLEILYILKKKEKFLVFMSSSTYQVRLTGNQEMLC